MIFWFIILYVLPICIFLSPLLFIFLSKRSQKKIYKRTFLTLAILIFVLVDLRILFRMAQLNHFERTNCGGRNLYRMADNEELRRDLSEQGLSLVISTKFCDSDCQKSMLSVKDKLDFILVREDDVAEEKKYYPIGHFDGLYDGLYVISPLREYDLYSHSQSTHSHSTISVFMISGNDPENEKPYCEKNYLCVVGTSIDHRGFSTFEMEKEFYSFFGIQGRSDTVNKCGLFN